MTKTGGDQCSARILNPRGFGFTLCMSYNWRTVIQGGMVQSKGETLSHIRPRENTGGDMVAMLCNYL